MNQEKNIIYAQMIQQGGFIVISICCGLCLQVVQFWPHFFFTLHCAPGD